MMRWQEKIDDFQPMHLFLLKIPKLTCIYHNIPLIYKLLFFRIINIFIDIINMNLACVLNKLLINETKET
jgi:hypothetical protein